jgi:hypothetical protein
MPATGAVLAAVLLATGAGVVLSGLTPSPGNSAPIVLKSVTRGALESSGIRLTQPPTPIECTPASWVHITLTGRCPVSQSTAEAAARSALPVFKAIPLPIGAAMAQATVVGGAAPVTSNAPPQIKEAVLAWADVPARSSPNGQALHAMVWAIAVDSPALGMRMCPPPIVKTTGGSVAPMAPFCIGGARYLVFIDAMSGKLRFLTARP